MANACVESYYFSGQGALLLAERDVNGLALGFVPVGNVSGLSISVERTEFEHKENCSGVRGIDLTITQEMNASLSMVMESLSKENLALSLYGTSNAIAAGSVAVGTPESVIAYLDKWCPLANINVAAVVVKDVTDVTTYVAGTDYEVNLQAGAIKPLSTGAIANLDVLHVSYTFSAAENVEAMTTGAPPVRWLRFEGMNTALTNQPVVVDVFKWSVAPLAELALINDEIAQMTVEGKILSDPTKVTGSKYFRQRFVK